jgi:putative thioredoxin
MEFILSGDQRPKAASGADIKDTTTRTFVQDVIEASKTVPVLVDFWAPWCGPCKQLTPLLEQAVRASGGKVKLVKMNIDDHPEVANQMGVQSIPAVFAFKDGRPVDGFMGAIPESQIRTFIERIAGSGVFAGSELEAAEAALEDGNIEQAANLFAKALSDDQENVAAIAGLAKCYVAMRDFDRAEQLLSMLPPVKQNAPEAASARAMLELARKSGEAGDIAALEKTVSDNPKDLKARFNLAIALHAKGRREPAMEQLLDIIALDRNWNDGAAREQLVQFFEAWGNNHVLTIEGRKRLSTVLFS